MQILAAERVNLKSSHHQKKKTNYVWWWVLTRLTGYQPTVRSIIPPHTAQCYRTITSQRVQQANPHTLSQTHWFRNSGGGTRHLHTWQALRGLLRHTATWDQETLAVVQSLSRVRLCDPMDCSTSGFPVHHQLPEPAQTHVHWVGDAIQPSHPLLAPSPPTFSVSQHQGLFK